ncbi:MAG TPA: DUF1249 domain-containing protein, partial [Cellvibrio sp.]|nr:DUF1249 domain-containing protein [Cellvibrio sp.]
MFTLRVAKPQPDYVTYRERYKVDLPLQMAECETNYLRLQKLLTQYFSKSIDAQDGDAYRFLISRSDQQWLNQIRILERSPYTTTLQITQTSVSATSSWLQMPRLTVRMYHDAKLAEVLAWEGHKRLRPRYEYPNRAMYHADEKLQINRFLGELLTLALREG